MFLGRRFHIAHAVPVAARSKGNQMIGTLTRRPSISETCIICSSKLMDFANADVGAKARRDLLIAGQFGDRLEFRLQAAASPGSVPPKGGTPSPKRRRWRRTPKS